MLPFDQKKASILREIGETLGDVPDALPKGLIDVQCLPIMAVINRHADMVTTSSCSGRILVFVEGEKEGKVGGKGEGGRWLYVNHIDTAADRALVFSWYESPEVRFDGDVAALAAASRCVLFKYEPMILHVACRDSATAAALFQTAMGCGFRESGIGSGNNVAVRISLRLDIPVGAHAGDALVSMCVLREYLAMAGRMALARHDENVRRMEKLLHAIEAMRVKSAVASETKEERRERKRREGLARQQQQT